MGLVVEQRVGRDVMEPAAEADADSDAVEPDSMLPIDEGELRPSAVVYAPRVACSNACDNRTACSTTEDASTNESSWFVWVGFMPPARGPLPPQRTDANSASMAASAEAEDEFDRCRADA